MNQNKQLLKTMCLIMAVSVLFVVMVEARPSSFSRPLVRKEHVHVLTEVQHVPDLGFFWDMTQKVNHYHHNLSDEQKIQLKEAFWDLYFRTIAVQEEALDNTSVLPEETSYFTQVEFIVAAYLKTLDDITRSGQHDRHHERKAGPKKFGRFYVAADSLAITLRSVASTDTQNVRTLSYVTQAPTDVVCQSAWAAFAQVHSQQALHHDLSQLQTFRL